MKVRRMVQTEIDVDAIRLVVPVRYDEEDIPKDFPGRSPVPHKDDVLWLTLDLATRKVRDWPEGRTAGLYMKVVDEGIYHLIAGDETVATLDQEPVPGCIPSEYGDYLAFYIAADGLVSFWDGSGEPRPARPWEPDADEVGTAFGFEHVESRRSRR